MIIDSPIISGSYLSTGSLSQTGNVSITGSLTATGGISGSFSGSGANLFGIPASGITGLNLSQISSGSVSASISPNQGLLINTSVSASNFTGSFTGSLTGIATSASYASFALTSSYSLGGSGFPFSGSAVITGSLLVSGSQTLTGSLSTTGPITASSVLATGTITAQTLVVSTISSSVQYSSGSNIFGSQLTNTQTFTGSVLVTGSISIGTNSGNKAINVISNGNQLAVGPSSATGLIVNTTDTSFGRALYVDNSNSGIAVYTNNNSATLGFYQGPTGDLSFGTNANRPLSFNNNNGGSSYLYFNSPNSQFTGNVIPASSTGTNTLGTSGSQWSALFISGSSIITGSLTVTGRSGSLFVSGSSVMSGSLNVSQGITGSLFGTASLATSASYAFTASSAISASYSATASYLLGYISPFPYSGSAQITGSLGVTGSFSVCGSTGTVLSSNADSLLITGSLLVTGSAQITGSLSVSGSITGSLFGTASFALDAATLTGTGSVGFTTTASFNAVSSSQQSISASLLQVSASYIALSASYNTFSGSASTRITTISSSQQDISASQQQISASLLTISRSYASTGSNTFVGLETITGSLIVTGSVAISTLVTSSGVRYVIADQNGLVSAQTASAAIFTTQQNIASAGQTVFPITNGYVTNYLTVFVNGTKLANDEFTNNDGVNVTFLTGSTAGDTVEFVKYMPASGVSNNVLRTVNYFTASLGQTNFTVNYTPGLLDVFYNGAKLDNTEYTAANGTSILLATGSNAGDTLEVDIYSYQVGAFSGIGGVGVANQIAYYNTTNSITGSNAFTVSGSAIIITGSLIVSGSGTFTNIGPAVFSGSVTAVGGFSGSFSGNADSASLAQNSLLLQGTGSVGFTTTASFLAVSGSQQQVSASYIALSASYNVFSGSASTRITVDSASLLQVSSSLLQVSASYIALSASYNVFSGSASTRVSQIEQVYATTGSNSFRATQSITGSLTVTGQIIAQTINVQQVTSSIVYSSGSNVFGCDLNSRQTFTGSVLITGSLNTAGTITGTTIYGSTAVCSPIGLFSGCLAIGTSTYYGKISVGNIPACSYGLSTVSTDWAGTTSTWTGIKIGAAADTGGAGVDIRAYTAYGATSATSLAFFTNTAGNTLTEKLRITGDGTACFSGALTAATLGTNDLILNNLNYECANYVDGTRGSWLIQEGACDLFIINQISCKKYKFNLIEIK